ncbi:11300_t:CDS:2, partial [Gigaspora rosea]
MERTNIASIENSKGIIALGNCYKGEIEVEKDDLLLFSVFRFFSNGFCFQSFRCCGACLSLLGLVGLWCLSFVAG